MIDLRKKGKEEYYYSENSADYVAECYNDLIDFVNMPIKRDSIETITLDFVVLDRYLVNLQCSIEKISKTKLKGLVLY